MKKIFIFFCLMCATSNFWAQDLTPAVELFFITENAPSSPVFSFTMTAQSQCWGSTPPDYPPQSEDYYLTDNFDNQTYSPSYNNMGSASAGFDFIVNNSPYSAIGYGLYKVTSTGTNKYFYIDYRDYRIGYYAYYSPPTEGNNIDLWIKYDYSEDKFYYCTYTYNGTYTAISNGELLNFWDIKEKGQQLTSLFPSYWSNCLALTNDILNHPRLVWGPHPTFSTTHFKLYRAVSQTPLAHPELQASLIATLSSSTYSYVDTDLHLHESGDYVYYFIKAYNSSNNSYSSITNVINTRAYFNKINPIAEQGYSKEEFRLSDNYPNPFNPSTKIQFIIPEEGRSSNKSVQTKLIVYDVLGRKVQTLLEEEKAAGLYEINFNASTIPSGIYYYRLTAGKYSETKKMMVIK